MAACVSSISGIPSQLSTSQLSTSRLAASIHKRSDSDKLTNILTILENLQETAEPPASTHDPSRSGETRPSPASTMAFPRSDTAGSNPEGLDGNWQLQPYTLQPFRDEIGRVVRHYVAATGDRSLPDLFPPERAACLRAARCTTHPSALLPAFLAAESALREQSFPRFVRDWCVGNVDPSSPRLFYGRCWRVSCFCWALPWTLS